MTATESETSTPQGNVVAKAALLIVIVGATGVGLLTERQQRFEAAHTMTIEHRKADALEREIRKLRAEIADRLTPARINAHVDTMEENDGQLRPILWSMNTAQGPLE